MMCDFQSIFTQAGSSSMMINQNCRAQKPELILKQTNHQEIILRLALIDLSHRLKMFDQSSQKKNFCPFTHVFDLKQQQSKMNKDQSEKVNELLLKARLRHQQIIEQLNQQIDSNQRQSLLVEFQEVQEHIDFHMAELIEIQGTDDMHLKHPEDLRQSRQKKQQSQSSDTIEIYSPTQSDSSVILYSELVANEDREQGYVKEKPQDAVLLTNSQDPKQAYLKQTRSRMKSFKHRKLSLQNESKLKKNAEESKNDMDQAPLQTDFIEKEKLEYKRRILQQHWRQRQPRGQSLRSFRFNYTFVRRSANSKFFMKNQKKESMILLFCKLYHCFKLAYLWGAKDGKMNQKQSKFGIFIFLGVPFESPQAPQIFSIILVIYFAKNYQMPSLFHLSTFKFYSLISEVFLHLFILHALILYLFIFACISGKFSFVCL